MGRSSSRCLRNGRTEDVSEKAKTAIVSVLSESSLPSLTARNTGTKDRLAKLALLAPKALPAIALPRFEVECSRYLCRENRCEQGRMDSCEISFEEAERPNGGSKRLHVGDLIARQKVLLIQIARRS